MSPDTPTDPRTAVNAAIQNLMANRLGRGFLPLGLLFAWGAVGMFFGGGLALPAGAVASAAAMLAYGLRIVQRAFGGPDRPWMLLASVGSIVPPVFSVYVLGWLGLRGFTLGFTATTLLSATLSTVLGVWALRSWMKVVEIERLAGVMAMNLEEKGGSA